MAATWFLAESHMKMSQALGSNTRDRSDAIRGHEARRPVVCRKLSSSRTERMSRCSAESWTGRSTDIAAAARGCYDVEMYDDA